MSGFFMGNPLLSIIIAVIVFGILVTGHEWGHFFVARKKDVMIEEFSIGMGPAIVSRQKGETLYSLRAIPLGGYCKMLGELDGDRTPRDFMSKTVWQRIQILLAGPVMNFIIAFVLVTAVLGMEGFVSTEIAAVTPGYGAEEAGILPGDRIISVNGKRIHMYEDIAAAMEGNGTNPVDVMVERDGEKYFFEITPKYSEETDRYLIGFSSAFKTGVFSKETDGYTKAGFGETLKHSGHETFYFIRMTLSGIGGLFTKKYTIDDLSGPVGIVKVIGDSYEAGMTVSAKAAIENVLYIAALLSANLGVINLIPIPALDGGRILLCIIEAIRGKALDAEKEGILQFIFFVFIFALTIFIAFKDITKLV